MTETEAGTPRKPVNSDLLGGSLGLALAALFWFTREQWSFWSAVFPNLTLAVLALLSAALVVKGLLRPELRAVLAEGSRARIIVTAVVLLAWAVAIRSVGTLVSSLVIFYALTLYLGSANQRLTFPLALRWLLVVLAQVVVLYLVFRQVLGVPLPRGILL